jgi:5-methylcytosine-specific restriction endonuclease McrA
MLKRLNNSARWRNGTRPIVLARDPVCQDGRVCENKAFSEVVDHVIPARDYIKQHGGDENAYFDDSNLRGSCKPCHDAKRDVGFGAKR